jgi:DNA-binding transcriptional LysR family regulator
VRNVDLAKLEALVLLAEELHFGRAAARLDVEVSTLSRRVRELERQLGVELFTRSSRRVVLTAAGAAITRQAERVLAEGAALEAIAAEAAKGRIGELHAGYSTASADPMSMLLRALRERDPGLTVVTQRRPSARIAEDVGFGHLAFGVCQPGAWLHAPGIGTVLLATMPVDRVMVPRSHRLAAQEAIAVAELEGETLVGPPASILATVPPLRSASGPVRTNLRRAASWEEVSLVDEVAAGYGLYLCTEDAARRNPHPDVVVRPLLGSLTRSEHWFVWRVDDDSPALQAVRSVVDRLIA